MKILIPFMILSLSITGYGNYKGKLEEERLKQEQILEEQMKEEVLRQKVLSESIEKLEPVPILMFHHFDNSNGSTAIVNKDDFIIYLDYLKDNDYNTLTMVDLYDIKNGNKELPDKPVFITSDDGYLSNYDFMFEELKKREMKATIFPIGAMIDRAQTNEIYEWELDRFNWTQSKEMVDSGLIDIQLHTYDSHNDIPYKYGTKGDFSVPKEGETEEDYIKRIDLDIKKNIRQIEEHLGYTPIAFAYPFGDYSELSEEVLKDNGIEISLLVREGKVNLSDELYLLNRINVCGYKDLNALINNLETTYEEFEERLIIQDEKEPNSSTE